MIVDVPIFVKTYCRDVLGQRVVYVAPFGSFDGTIEDAWVDGKRIKYKVKQDSGRIRLIYADQVAHLGPKETRCQPR